MGRRIVCLGALQAWIARYRHDVSRCDTL